MNTAREILKQADDLKLDQAEMEKLTAAIARQLDGTNWEVSFGFGWFPIPVSVMHVIRDGVEALSLIHI